MANVKKKAVTKTNTRPVGRPRKTDLTSDNLAELIWDSVQKVKNGKIKTDVANSVFKGSKEICNIYRLKLQAAKLGEKQGSKNVSW